MRVLFRWVNLVFGLASWPQRIAASMSKYIKGLNKVEPSMKAVSGNGWSDSYNWTGHSGVGKTVLFLYREVVIQKIMPGRFTVTEYFAHADGEFSGSEKVVGLTRLLGRILER